MRRLLLGLGSAQVLVTAALVGLYAALFVGDPWNLSIVIGLGLAMSSTAGVLTLLQQRGALTSEHGQATFAVLMAQDLWVVPALALVPILAHSAPQPSAGLGWRNVLLVVGAIGVTVALGRYLLPSALAYAAERRRMQAFGILLFLAVLAAAWVMQHAGLEMTLGAFLMGVLLSASDYRYQIEATVEPFKGFLMGLFFISVGMSIDVGAMLRDWSELLVHVPVVMSIKAAVLIALALAFGVGRAAAVRTGCYLAQSGEFAFVLLGAAAEAGLMSAEGLTVATLVVAASMILTPLGVKAGDRLAARLDAGATDAPGAPEHLDRHVVVIGYDEVGQLICLMLEKADIPYVAFDARLDRVREGRQWGKSVSFGNMYSPVTQQAAALGRASAAFVSTTEDQALAVTLSRLYPGLDVFVRARSLREQGELIARGIQHAGTAYIESTLFRGRALLTHLGMAEADVDELIENFRHDGYALLQTAQAEAGDPQLG